MPTRPRLVERLSAAAFAVFAVACAAATAEAVAGFSRTVATPCAGTGCAYPRLDTEAAAELAHAGIGLDAWATVATAVLVAGLAADAALALLVAVWGRGPRRWAIAAVWPALGFGAVSSSSGWPWAIHLLPPLGLIGFFWLLATFPTLRPVPRWVAVPASLASAWAVLCFGIPPVAWAIAHAEQPWNGLVGPGFLACLAAILIGQAVRFRGAAPATRRRQGQLIVAVAVMIPFGVSGAIVSSTAGAGYGTVLGALLNLGASLSTTVVLLVLASAAVRDGAYGVRVVVDHVLSGAALVALAVAGYAVVVGAASALVPAGPAAAVAAIATALLLAGSVHRVLRAIDRLVHGDAADPALLVAAAAAPLQDAPSAAAVLPAMLQEIADRLHLPGLAFTPTGEEGPVAFAGATAGPAVLLPLRTGATGAPLGTLRVGLRRGQRRLTGRDRRALAAMAAPLAAGWAVRRLTATTERAQREVVTARERERAALRRRLHDGVGPALAAARHRIDAADADLGAPGVPDAVVRDQLARAGDALAGAYAQVRDLSRDLRPPALDELGLADALAGYARDAGVTLDLDARVDPPEPHRVAVYRIAVEAIANAAHHGGAAHVRVALAHAGDAFSVTIADDGRGLPEPLVPGVGLASMRGRAEELGGRLVLGVAPGGGALVTAVLPAPQGSGTRR